MVVDVHVEKRTLAPKGESRGRSQPLVCRDHFGQGKIGDHVAVIAKDRGVPLEKVFYVLQPSPGVEKDRLVAKDDGHAAPFCFGKYFTVNMGTMVRVDDEPLYPDGKEMVHGIGYYRPASEGEERLRAFLRERTQACPKAGAEDEGRFEPSTLPHQ
jgi:hypothetical protein